MAKNSVFSKLSSIFRAPVEKKTVLTAPLMNWDISQKGLNPYYGMVSGNYYAMTGMPWLSSDARKAVMTEWFWQPIRGQPRRVDTNELRKYSNTVWVQSIVMTILNQICSIPWDIIPITGKEKENIDEEKERVKLFLENPNKNTESLNDLIRAWVKDVLEIDAGVIVKVFTPESYDFEHLEPRSGAPLLKPLICPECNGTGKGSMKSFKEKAQRSLIEIKKAENSLPVAYKEKILKKNYTVIKPDYEPVRQKLMEIVSYNSPNDANAIDYGTGEFQGTCPYCNGTGQGRQLVEIYARDGASFLKDADRTGWTYGYWQYSYAIPAHPMWFNRDELVYFNQNQRSMSVYGYSAVQSSLEIIKSLEYSVKHNMSLFLDGAVPDGVVSVEDMGNEEMKRMKTYWEDELKGQPHKVVFLNKKTNFVPFAFNNRDMQFLEGQKEAWKQVIANFNMTPTDLGFTQDVNRSSATQQTELTRRKSIRPLIKKIEELINKQIMPELRVEKVKFKYIVDDPVEERKAAELAEIYLRNGLKTVNEIRISMGQPTVDWGDENPKDAMMAGIGARGQVTGRASEVTEERPAENEAQRREKDYQTAFQAQVPFLTSTQNLTTNTPFALPKTGHVNTRYPYSDMGGRCPGCGMPTLETVLAENGSLNEPGYHCIRCDRRWSSGELAEEINCQRKLHGENTIAPKVTAESTSMNTAPHPNLLGVAERVQEYTETQGYPKKKLLKILREKNKDKMDNQLFELGVDQGTSIDLIKHAEEVVPILEKKIRKESLFKKGALLIDNFNDFVSIVEANENHASFNQMKRYVEETDELFTFRYADKYYRYECDVPKESIPNIDDFRSRYVATATPAKKRKRKIILEE